MGGYRAVRPSGRSLLLALLACLVFVPVAAAATSTGQITVQPNGGGTVTTQAIFERVPVHAYPEVTVSCPGYTDTAVAPTDGDSASPWSAAFSGLPSGESCTATLFYYTRTYKHETNAVILAATEFTVA